MALSSANGSYTDYPYSGNIVTEILSNKGIYKLEVWGAGGGKPTDGTAPGGKGGYSVGYLNIDTPQTVYVCVGATGSLGVGGYNGGGNAHHKSSGTCAGGGGATHIATKSGTLKSLGSTSGLLIVAGGGGGAGYNSASADENGKNGGGTTGVAPYGASAASQTAPGKNSSHPAANGAFGQGGTGQDIENATWHTRGAGGGAGLYGGAGGASQWGGNIAGGGGSGYIGGVPSFIATNGTEYSPSTTQGGGSASATNGKARITYIGPDSLPVYFNGTRLTKLIFNGTEVTSLIFNGTKLFMRRLREEVRGWYTSMKPARFLKASI